MRAARSLRLGVALVATGALLGALYASHVGATRRAARTLSLASAAALRGEPVLLVPHLHGPITLDGDTDDPGWLLPPGPARTQDFVLPTGKPARPYSEARILWGGDYLYFALYASDEDIQSHVSTENAPFVPGDDQFRLVFAPPDGAGPVYRLDVSPRGVLREARRLPSGEWGSGWSSEAHASSEVDGTVNDPANTDEEWAIELAIPFASLGMRGEPGETLALSMSRCDTPKTGGRVCAGWGEGTGELPRGRLVLEPVRP